jgi:hypothetical protein
MTLRFYFIEGQRRSACNNDAISVVSEDKGRPEVLDIIPADDIPGSTRIEKLQNAPLVFTGYAPLVK